MRPSFRPELFVTLTAIATLAAGCTPAPDELAATTEQAAVGPSSASSPSQSTVTAERPIIVMLGDSLTAGYQLPEQDALPEQLQARLDAAAAPATIVNAGVSGDTTRGGLERYDWSVTGANADILLIALGGNDFLNRLNPGVPKANLAAIIERAQADGVMVALIGISIPTREGLDSRDQAFDAIYPDLAAQYDIPLFPNMMAPVFGHPDRLMSDGIHPTAEGVSLIGQELSVFVADLADAWRAGQGATPVAQD